MRWASGAAAQLLHHRTAGPRGRRRRTRRPRSGADPRRSTASRSNRGAAPETRTCVRSFTATRDAARDQTRPHLTTCAPRAARPLVAAPITSPPSSRLPAGRPAPVRPALQRQRPRSPRPHAPATSRSHRRRPARAQAPRARTRHPARHARSRPGRRPDGVSSQNLPTVGRLDSVLFRRTPRRAKGAMAERTGGRRRAGRRLACASGHYRRRHQHLLTLNQPPARRNLSRRD